VRSASSTEAVMTILFRVMFGLACGVIGFCVGGLIAAELVPLPLDGLAAAARVATFSSFGGLTGLVSGVLLGRRVADGRRGRALFVVTVIAALCVAVVAVRGAARRRARAAASGQTVLVSLPVHEGM
jgi:hypothetical protein